jgi:hypothetical protein
MKNLSLIPFLFLLLVFLPSIALSECIEGNCQNGQGTYIHSDGDQYKGEWKDGRKHGQGTYTYSDGKRYEGEWKKGMRHGLGKVIDEKGVESKNGYWKNGSFKGGKP